MTFVVVVFYIFRESLSLSLLSKALVEQLTESTRLTRGLKCTAMISVPLHGKKDQCTCGTSEIKKKKNDSECTASYAIDLGLLYIKGNIFIYAHDRCTKKN